VAEISALGDLRPGSLTAAPGVLCRCHQPGEKRHGPKFRVTYKANGKTVTESFPTPAIQRKAEREAAEFQKYRELSRAFVATNEEVCRAGPVTTPCRPRKKRPKRMSKKSPKK
jgi:hypothetical protein